MHANSLIWYAAYGSNIQKKRFMYYIKGGTPRGSSRPHPGCKDQTDPRDDREMRMNRSLYFARRAKDWNDGGVAFVGQDTVEGTGTLGRLYLISAGQFMDIFSQENGLRSASIDFDRVKKKGFLDIAESWYGRVLYAGKESGCPVFTFTSPLPLNDISPNAPSDAYLRTVFAGIWETHRLTIDEIVYYMCTKPGIKGNYSWGELHELAMKSRNPA